MYGVGGSEAISRDMNSYLFSSTLKHSSEGEFTKNRDLMSSDLYHDHQQQQQQSSALMRNRSAPSSFFASLVDESGNGGEDYLNHQSSSPESETIFAGFVSGNGSGESDSRDVLQYPTAMKHETTESVPEQNDYSAASRIVYSTAPSRDMPNHNSLGNGPSMESSYSVMNSVATENLNQVKTNSGNCSNLIRQSSSPAGFLSHMTAENGFAAMRDVGNLRASNRIGVEASPSTSRLSNNMNFSSGPSTSRFIPQTAENENGSVVRGSPENAHLGNSNDTNRCYVPVIPNDSWNNSTFSSLKRNRDGDLKMFSSSNGLDTQNGDLRHYTPGLVHHLSLPKTSAEMAAVEQYLQFQQDAVPCKIRAKRGFATHPRSIAERVRRTRISERMKKLQELFPNMDKQANTADMLDLAVEYIKDLQREVQTLKETRARCTCSIKQKQSSPTA